VIVAIVIWALVSSSLAARDQPGLIRNWESDADLAGRLSAMSSRWRWPAGASRSWITDWKGSPKRPASIPLAGAHAQAAIDCLIRLQSASGGNALIGRQLQPLLAGAGYGDVVVRPRTVYADQTRPEYVSGFTRNTFTAMVEAVRGEALAAGLSTAARWDQGIADLRRTADDGGTFHYTFFKAVAVNPGPRPEFGAASPAGALPSLHEQQGA
jgi:hypothetical protein